MFCTRLTVLVLLVSVAFGQTTVVNVRADGSSESTQCGDEALPCNSISTALVSSSGALELRIDGSAGPVQWGQPSTLTSRPLSFNGTNGAVLELGSNRPNFQTTGPITFANLEITGSQTFANAVITFDSIGSVSWTDVVFDNHHTTIGSGGAINLIGGTSAEFTRVEVRNVVAPNAAVLSIGGPSMATINDCYFHDNSGEAVLRYVEGNEPSRLWNSLLSYNNVNTAVVHDEDEDTSGGVSIEGCTSIIANSFHATTEGVSLLSDSDEFSLASGYFGAIGAVHGNVTRDVYKIGSVGDLTCGVHGFFASAECRCPTGGSTAPCACDEGELPQAPTMEAFRATCATDATPEIVCSAERVDDVDDDANDELMDDGADGDGGALNVVFAVMGIIGGVVLLGALVFLTAFRSTTDSQGKRTVQSMRAEAMPTKEPELLFADDAQSDRMSVRTTSSKMTVQSTASSVAPRLRRDMDGDILQTRKKPRGSRAN